MNLSPSDAALDEAFDDRPVSYEDLQRGYEDMRDLCRDAQAGWTAERRKLWAAEAAIAEALRWLNVDNASGTGYVNRIWEARKALAKVSTPTTKPRSAE
jgi:hypothetical protein